MTTLFLSYAPENVDCAEQLRTALIAKGFTPWLDPGSPHPGSALYPFMIENAILGSAALVLVWSASALQAQWVEHHLLFAGRLIKPIFPLLLDSTPLPTTLVGVSSIVLSSTCAAAVDALIALPAFPAQQSADPLLHLYEQAASDRVQVRKDALEQAAQMLARNEHRQPIMALLEYLAKTDLIMSVRERSQEVLDADAWRSAPPTPIPQTTDARYLFGVRCKNGHISYFDKRVVCAAHLPLPRLVKSIAGKTLDELRLNCTTCGEEVIARVDCEDYR